MKHLHFIGIAGTAMASLARAFSIAGFKITGSEPKEVFPPMSDYLKNNKINYYIGFDKNKVGSPDEIIIGNAHYSDQNPEVIYTRENKIELEHFPRLVEKYLIRKNSVVVAGTYGKTTITAMITWLLEKWNKNPNYMLGGIPLNFNHGARLTQSNWSVVEGDEYPAASPWDYSPKFNFYHPKYLILTSAEWDHMDIYKSKKSYVDVFKKLVSNMPKHGIIIAKKDGENLEEVLKEARCRIIYYSLNTLKPLKSLKKSNKITTYQVNKVNYKKFLLTKNNKNISEFETQLIGDFNLENWAASLALAYELKIPERIIQQAVKSFKGVKRRLEIRAVKKEVSIIDDFAHSPSKAKESVKALKQYFSNKRIFVIFEPNRGGRSIKCLKKYDYVFNGVYQVIIPKLTNYKRKSGVKDVSGKELARYLKLTNQLIGGLIYQPDNQKIIKHLFKSLQSGDIVAFLGSRDFGGIIEEVIKRL